MPLCPTGILQTPAGPCPTSVGDDACIVPGPCHAATPRRRAKTPALHCGRERAATDERPLSVRPAGGPMKIIGPYAGACGGLSSPAGALYCRAGVHARRKGLRWPGRILARRSAAPLRLRLAAHPPPLAGEAFGGLPFERLPCKGLRSRAPPAAEKARRSRCSGRRMQACFSMRRMMRAPQTGNVGVSRLRGQHPASTIPFRGAVNLPGGRSRPPGKFAAADGSAAGEIALQRARMRAAAQERQPHVRPDGGPTQGSPPAQGPAACRSRFCLPFAVYCRAGVHARRGTLRQRKAQGTMPASSPAEAG